MGNQISIQPTKLVNPEYSHALVLLNTSIIGKTMANLSDIKIIKTSDADDYVIIAVLCHLDMEDEVLPNDLAYVRISPESRREISPTNACSILQDCYRRIILGEEVSKVQLVHSCMTKLLDSTPIDRFLRHLMITYLQSPKIISIMLSKSCFASDRNADIRMLHQYYQFCENNGIRISDSFREWYEINGHSFQKLHVEHLFGQISKVHGSAVLHNGKIIPKSSQMVLCPSTIFIDRCSIRSLVQKIPVKDSYGHPLGNLVLIKPSSWNSRPVQNLETPAIGIVSGKYTPSGTGKRGGCEKTIVEFLGTRAEKVTITPSDLESIAEQYQFSVSSANQLGDQWHYENKRPSSETADQICHRRFHELEQALNIEMVTEPIPISSEIIVQLLRMENPFIEPFFIRDDSGQPYILSPDFIAGILREFKIQRNESRLVEQVLIQCIICSSYSTDMTKRYDCDHDVCSVCIARTTPNYTTTRGSKILPANHCCPFCPAVRKITNGTHDEIACQFFRVHGRNGDPIIKSPGFCELCIEIIDKAPGACVDPNDPNPQLVRYCETHARPIIPHYRTCPGPNLADPSGICGVMHQKDSGCDHITCPRIGCGTHYCMRCGFQARSHEPIYHHMSTICYFTDQNGNMILGYGIGRM